MARTDAVHRVPASRYTSATFAALELERMWPRVWQIACTLDHVADAGDVFEYRAGPLSVLVVRGDDGGLRAFQNACRHRGNAICTGSDRGLTELRCPFHRWAYGLDGRLREVPNRAAFGPVRNDDLGLVEACVDSWGPLVFVNLDRDCMPLDEYLAPVPDDIAWVGIDDFRCPATVTTPVRANWKVVADGFSETYHVPGLHPELNQTMDDTLPQRVWEHTGCSQQDYGVANPRLRGLTDEDVWAGFVSTQGMRAGYDEKAPMPDLGGRSVGEVLAEGIVATQAAAGVDLSGLTSEQLLRLSQYNVFPNATVLVFPDLLTVLLGRPLAGPGGVPAVDEAELVFYYFQRVPPGAPRVRPADVVAPEGQADLGLVFNQDLGILESMQRGLHQPGLTHLTVSGFECRLRNTHRNLERYLGIGPDE